MKTAKLESKKRVILLSLLVVGLLAPLMYSPSATAADFLNFSFACPASNKTLLPPAAKLEISDIIISSDADQRVSLKFMPGSRFIVRPWVKGFDSVVTNFSRPIESADEEALKLDCDGTGARVTVTVVGSSTY